MKAADIVKQLAKTLPLNTNEFSKLLAFSSMTNVGNLITVITTSPHKLITGAGIVVTGTSQKYPIDVLTRFGTIATCSTTVDNDLTSGDPARPNITLSGADQAGYNGAHKLLAVANRRNFTFEVDISTPTPGTGVIFLEDGFRSAFNGRFIITVLNPTTFNFTVSGTVADNTVGGTPSIKTSVRVAKSVTIERALEAYTSQLQGDMWAFVILDDTTQSKDRAILDDASRILTKSDRVRAREVQTVDIYVFIPTEDKLDGADAKDLARNEIKKAIYQSLFLFNVPSIFNDAVFSLLTPVSDGTFIYELAYYVHVFRFERVIDLVRSDGVELTTDVAFRDITFDAANEFGEITWSATVDLDDQPL